MHRIRGESYRTHQSLFTLIDLRGGRDSDICLKSKYLESTSTVTKTMSDLKKCFLITLTLTALVSLNSQAHAFGFRVGLLPNGSSNRCANCHNDPGGGGPRNGFGQDVDALLDPGSRDAFWALELALEDSDGDGFTNGAELGDFDGDGVAERTVNITNPGLALDTPIADLGDCNLDRTLDTSDLSCVDAIDARDAVLEALNTLPGDLDGDGEVAFSDFLILSANFRSDARAYTDGNINLQGTIDFADFLILSNNFGNTVAASATASAVPEPSGAMLASLVAICLLSTRKRRI